MQTCRLCLVPRRAEGTYSDPTVRSVSGLPMDRGTSWRARAWALDEGPGAEESLVVKLAARRGWRDGEIGLPPVKGRRAGGSSGEGHGYAMGSNRGNNSRSRVSSASVSGLFGKGMPCCRCCCRRRRRRWRLGACVVLSGTWDVRCLGSSRFRPGNGHEAGIGVGCDLQVLQAWTQELSADPSVFTGPSQPLETA